MINETLLNRFFIAAAIICTIAGVIAIIQYLGNIKMWMKRTYATPQPVGQEYLDMRMMKLINDKIPAASVVSDVYGKIIWVNEWALHILHWRKDELIGKKLEMIIPEKERPMHNNAMEEYRQTGHGKIFGKPMRLQCLTKGDITIPVEITIVEAQDDNRVLIIAKIRDMTQQLEEITKMQRQINLYKKVEEDGCIGFFQWDFADDKVYMSDNMINIFDLNAKDNSCPSEVLTSCVVSNDRKRVGDTILQAINTKSPGYEMEYNLRNGKLIKTVSTIEYNEAGEVTVINGALRVLKKSNV